jgi:DNA repair protein RecO (recombination protein O)
MELTTQGIVLRKVPYTGTSMVVSIYTRRKGALTFMARGMGRKGGGMSKAAIQVLSRVELQATFRENRQMQSLKDIRPNADACGLLESPPKAAVAMFLAEVLYKSLREEAPDEDLFDFLDEAVAYFSREPFQADFHLIFLMHLTRYFGFFPSGKFEKESDCFDLQEGIFGPRPFDARPSLQGVEALQFDQLARASFGESPLDLRHADRRNLLAGLLRYYELHLEGMGKIKSLAVLTEVFS